MSFLSFKINKEFVEGYANRKVPWGFVDANGTSVSEITYLRTYSRIKEDGSKERWHETCERVINGTFSLQKDWAKKNRLPWNDNKAQKAAQEAYHNLWSFKWSPPGRGLWAMGTERVHGERGSSTALNNCLRGDTGVITSTGVKKIKDLAGTKPTLLTENGKWVQAPVASFGNQRLMKVTLQRAKSDSKVIYATPDHRWFTRHAKRSSGQWTETLTKDLTDKHQLKSVYGQGVKGRSMVPSPFGVAHGFVFGDGRRAPGDRNSNSVTLFGDKDKSLFKYFELCLSRENNTCDVPGIEFSQIPNYFFDKPSLSETKTYLLGWLSGYFAADGYVSSDGANVSLTSYNRENLEYVRNVCSVLGIGVFQIREGRRVSNLTGRKHTYYSVSFMRDTLSEEFFVLDKHRERFSSNGHGSRRYNWRIVSVEETDLVEEVFCATVDGTHSFVLEDNILTGNCSVWSTRYMTKDDPSYPFVKLANNSFLGVGVGFDTEGAKKGFVVQEPVREGVYEVPDTREGWADSVGVVINAYLKTGAKLPEFDYSQIRPEGSPIKTFGGIAPGPGPLIKMHKDLCEILSNRIGEELSTVDIVDIANIIGVGVVSGGVRRSALLAAGDIDDQAFIESKDYEKYPYRSGFGWMSNNSVKANVGDDLTHILDGIKLNGEPGILWLDVAHNYGRIEDGPRTDDQKTVATNPCFTGRMRLMTKEYGFARFDELDGKNFQVWNGSRWTPSKAWYTGQKRAYRLTLTNGQFIELTGDHVLEDSNGNEVTVETLTEDTRFYPMQGPGSWDGDEIDPATAVLLGLLCGDGYLDNAQGYNPVIRTREPEVIDFVLGYGQKHNYNWSYEEDKLYLRGFRGEYESYGFDFTPLPHRTLPENIFSYSSSTIRNILRGLYSANGSSLPKNRRIMLKTTSSGLVEQVRLLLMALGFVVYNTTNGPSEIQWANGTYRSRESYDLNIGSGWGYEKFQEEIGFLHEHKSRRLDVDGVVRVRSIGVRSIEDLGEVSVYDFCEPETHWGMVNGFKAHNCGEIFLEGQGELCCLADVYIGRQDSKEEFFRSLKNAYLYAKTVTLLPTEDPDTNSVIQRNRRIGVSMSGTADFADVHGLPKLREWMDDGYKYLKSLDEKYSKWLCVRESIRLTTIKPGGTTGIVAAQSPGVHWTPGGKYFKRGIVFQKNDPIVEQLRQAGYEVEDSYYTPETSVFVQFPIKSQAKRSEGEVTLFEKANLAATAQRYWADNSVSVTLSFDVKEESEQLPTVLQMYEGQLKSASFLPQGSDIYPQQPYQKMTEEDYNRVEGMALPVDLDPVYRGNAIDGEGEAYCQSDKCEIPKA